MFIVEGNIGAGKSTFLRLIAHHLPHIGVVYEPRERWQCEEGASLLRHFYIEPRRWAYTMETLAMVWRVREHLTEQQHVSAHRIMERSIYSGHYVFAHNDFEQKFMTPLEWNLYNQWFEFLVRGKCRPPYGFIYLDTTPETSYTRIKNRSRGSEDTIGLEYLQQLDTRHRAFLLNKQNVLPELTKVPVLTLDFNPNLDSNRALYENYIHRVNEFVNSVPANITFPPQETPYLQPDPTTLSAAAQQ